MQIQCICLWFAMSGFTFNQRKSVLWLKSVLVVVVFVIMYVPNMICGPAMYINMPEILTPLTHGLEYSYQILTES